MKKCKSYIKHLHSYHFKLQRDFAWFISLRRCNICFKRFGLEVHHLGYFLVDTPLEWLSLRFVCRRCHRLTGKIFFIRVYNTILLTLNFYFFLFLYWASVGLIRLILRILRFIFFPTRFPSVKSDIKNTKKKDKKNFYHFAITAIFS